MNPMQVAVVNKWDQFGGAARAAFRLYQALQASGIGVHYFVNEKTCNDQEIVAVANSEGYEWFLETIIHRYYINENRTELSNTWFSFTCNGSLLHCEPSFLDADIVNLHWVEQFVSLKSLQGIVALGKPIVWTLHDQRPFTGGCHYTAGCDHFEENCTDCPQLREDPHHLPAVYLQKKKEVLQHANMTIVSPSNWLAEEAKKSSLFCGRRVKVIPNSVDINIYRPQPKPAAKKHLGIPTQTTTLMFGALYNNEKRKGVHILLKALNLCCQNSWFEDKCRNGSVLVLVVGNEGDALNEVPLPVRQLGYIESDTEMASVYCATDFFVLPSLEDNLPNTILEAMSCGTPTVAFDAGGIPDLVEHGYNGFLVERGSAEALAAAILDLLLHEDVRARLSVNCRSKVERHYTREVQAKGYTELFGELLASSLEGTLPTKQKCDLDAPFEPVIGYAVTRHLRNLRDKGVVPGGMFDNQYEKLVSLREAVEEICEIPLVRHPVRKLRAYRKVLATYRNIQ